MDDTDARRRDHGGLEVRGDGRQRLYRRNGRLLRPIHDWVSSYEESWSHRFGQAAISPR
jgi:hypothetical protein